MTKRKPNPFFAIEPVGEGGRTRGSRPDEVGSLKSSTSRGKLAPRNSPYWYPLAKGMSLGYRVGKAGAGAWYARVFFSGGRPAQQESFGKADDLEVANGETVFNFDQAKEEAQKICKRILEAQRAEQEEGAERMVFVRDALLAYLRDLAAASTSDCSAARSRIHKTIEEIGHLKIRELKRKSFTDWRDRFIDTAPRVRNKKSTDGGQAEKAYAISFDPKDSEHKRKRQSSFNRALTDVKAALNRIYEADQSIIEYPVWNFIKPFKNTEGVRDVVLDLNEQIRLLNACSPEFRPIVYGGLYTGARYGELAKAKVKNFDFDNGVLNIGEKGKTGHRVVPLCGAAILVFSHITAGRSPEEYMFLRANGQPWEKSSQQDPIQEARMSVCPDLTFYGLRHTTITTMLLNGVELAVVADALGNSIGIIQKHYKHIRHEWAGKELDDKMPTLGISKGEIAEILEKMKSKRRCFKEATEELSFSLESLHPSSYMGKVQGGRVAPPPKPDRPDKETLSRMVLELPMLKIAEHYQVTEAYIRKLCRKMDIKTFPRGYWSKVRAHESRESRVVNQS